MNSQQEPFMVLATMSRWYIVSRAIHVVAQLGIANHMSDQPMSVKELAEKSQTKPELLDRLIKFLSSYQIFKAHETGYTLSELAKPLRDDDPHSIRDVLCMVDESWWQAFAKLEANLKTGESAFYLQHHDNFFNFLSKDSQKQANFDRGMAKLSSYDDDSISQAYDFSQLKSLVDMGGGRGGMVKSLANHYSLIQLTLFDTPSVIEQLNQADFPANIELVAGNFLEKIPVANAYLFKGVLHDFDDKTIQQIIKNCAVQMPKTASLFIAEQVMPDDDKPHTNKVMDILMMVLLNGRQRNLADWQSIIEPLGFRFVASYSTSSLFTLMEFHLT